MAEIAKSNGSGRALVLARGFALAAFGLLALIIVAVNLSRPPLTVPERLQRVSGVENAEQKGADIQVIASVKPVAATFYMTDSLDLVSRIAERLHDVDLAGPPSVGNIVVSIKGPAVDRLGHTSQEPFITLSFPAADLKRAEFHNLTFGGQADLADDVHVENGAGFEAVRAFCRDSRRGSDSRTFCPFVKSRG